MSQQIKQVVFPLPPDFDPAKVKWLTDSGCPVADSEVIREYCLGEMPDELGDDVQFLITHVRSWYEEYLQLIRSL